MTFPSVDAVKSSRHSSKSAFMKSEVMSDRHACLIPSMTEKSINEKLANKQRHHTKSYFKTNSMSSRLQISGNAGLAEIQRTKKTTPFFYEHFTAAAIALQCIHIFTQTRLILPALQINYTQGTNAQASPPPSKLPPVDSVLYIGIDSFRSFHQQTGFFTSV